MTFRLAIAVLTTIIGMAGGQAATVDPDLREALQGQLVPPAQVIRLQHEIE